MTRIVGGHAKGRHLAVPERGTRPTSDRAREGLFNVIATMLDVTGARVLDLFAGSGAVGLEALSRGASQVTFIESDRTAVGVIERNIAAVGMPGASAKRRRVETYLQAPGVEDPFDLVFLDPPYAFADRPLRVVLGALGGEEWTRAGTVVIVERSIRSPEPEWPDVIEPVKQKRYGEGMLWYGRRR